MSFCGDHAKVTIELVQLHVGLSGSFGCIVVTINRLFLRLNVLNKD